jgi:hypothetical protein
VLDACRKFKPVVANGDPTGHHPVLHNPLQQLLKGSITSPASGAEVLHCCLGSGDVHVPCLGIPSSDFTSLYYTHTLPPLHSLIYTPYCMTAELEVKMNLMSMQVACLLTCIRHCTCMQLDLYAACHLHTDRSLLSPAAISTSQCSRVWCRQQKTQKGAASRILVSACTLPVYAVGQHM